MAAAAHSLQPYQVGELQRAFEHLQSGRGTEALAIARLLVAHAPQAPDAQQLLALSLAETGEVDAAILAFERALELAPANAMILSNYAALLRRMRRASDALAVAQRVTRAGPDCAKAWLDLSVTARQAGDFAQAREAAVRALGMEPDSIAALQALGNAARAQEDLQSAQQAFSRLVVRAPLLRQGWLGLGDSQRRAGRADLAIATYARARQYIDCPELDDALAGALLDTGQVGEAISCARHLTRSAPQFAAGWTTLTNLAWEYDEPDAGQADAARFQACVAAQPDNTALRLALVRFLLATRQADAALFNVRALRVLADDRTLALLEAQALALLDRDDAADCLYADVHARGGDRDVAFLNAYARHQLRCKRPEAAAALASSATRIQPRNQEAWAYLGTAWRLLDDPREQWLCDYAELVGFVEVEPPAGFAAREDFLEALLHVLLPLHRARREPMQQSLRKGSQTPGRLFGRNIPLLEQVRAALLRAVEGWISRLPNDADHPFLSRKRPDVHIGGSWSVKLRSSGRHANHIHSEGWMSSAFYVSLPPSVGEGNASARTPAPGAIQFGQPPEELGLALTPRRVIQPVPGRLALFPSYLWHGTIPFFDEAPRVTVAFDMTPTTGHAVPVA